MSVFTALKKFAFQLSIARIVLLVSFCKPSHISERKTECCRPVAEICRVVESFLASVLRPLRRTEPAEASLAEDIPTDSGLATGRFCPNAGEALRTARPTSTTEILFQDFIFRP
jgi:hypothetical protein